MDTLVLFKSDLNTYVRLYGFLSQIFDYGNTDIEKRALFFRLLHPLLTFGREREGVDLSALRLTAFTIKEMGDHQLVLGAGDAVKIEPTQDSGSAQVQDKLKVLLQELIAQVNDLFEGDLLPGDKLVYVNNVIKGKLLESNTLIEQAMNNSREQFAHSPDFDKETLHAVMDTLAAHSLMSKQALESPRLRSDIQAVLLGPGGLYEELRERGGRAVHCSG